MDGATLDAGSFTRASVHGTIVAGTAGVVPVAGAGGGAFGSRIRHCDQLARMRFVPSHSGKPELKRPPGEGPLMVRTSFCVACTSAGPAMPALASTAWLFAPATGPPST